MCSVFEHGHAISRQTYLKNTDPSHPTAVSHFCQELDHLKLKFHVRLLSEPQKVFGKFCFQSIYNLHWPSFLFQVWLKPEESVIAYFSLCCVHPSVHAEMLPPDVLETALAWALLWEGGLCLYICMCQVLIRSSSPLQCRQHLLVLAPRGVVRADRQGSGQLVVCPHGWPVCLCAEWRAAQSHTHTLAWEKRSNCNEGIGWTSTWVTNWNSLSRQLLMSVGSVGKNMCS